MLLLAALGFVLAGAGLLMAALAARKQARLEREQRTRLIAHATSAPVRKTDPFGGLLKARASPFDARLRAIFTVGIKRTWAMKSGSLTLLLAAGASVGWAWTLAFQFLGSPPLLAAIVCLAAGFLVPRFVLAREQKRTERKFTDAFPDSVDTISRMVRAGLPISAAVNALAVEAKPPVGAVFAAIADQLRIGVPIEIVLDGTSTTIGLPDFRFFAIVVGLQHETGGNLAQAMENLSDLMRKRRAARLKVKAATGEIRMTAYTLAALPFFNVGMLLVIQPDSLRKFIADPRSHVILAAAGACLVAAFVIMRAMMQRLTND